MEDRDSTDVADPAVLVALARRWAASGDEPAATGAYLEALTIDPTHFDALNELGNLALSRGLRSAARRAYAQAVACHPGNPIGRVNLANVLAEDGDHAEAGRHYEAALALAPDLPEAHQGLGRVRAASGDPRAWTCWRKGFSGHAILQRPVRGVGPAIPTLLLASVQLGNMPTQAWLDDRIFAVTVIHVEFSDPGAALPPHALIVNGVGDADLCPEALARAQRLIDRSDAPALNPPSLVEATSRLENARRLGRLPGVAAPRVALFPRAALEADPPLDFPLLLRSPGFHTGLNFVRVDERNGLAAALDALPGEALLAIECLDARGADGMARKYRVMVVGGALYPLHLAVSAHWKVHYFSAAMADNAAYRDEERRFLEAMPEALGDRAMNALGRIAAEVRLDYFGIDFGLGPDGRLLLFEANATMAVIPPPPEAIWAYRRQPVRDIIEAAKRMALAAALGR